MLARYCHTGVMPTVSEQRASTKEWLAVLLCPFGAALVLTVAVVDVSFIDFGSLNGARYQEHHDALRGLSIDVNSGERLPCLGQTVQAQTTFVMHLNGSWQLNLARCGLVIPLLSNRTCGNSPPGWRSIPRRR